MRILLVEDDDVLIEVLLKSLAQQQYIVDTAMDGASGWNCTHCANYDLILLDVGLPKLDGITLCQQLRSEGCKTPILLMTAREERNDRIRGLDAGADDYLLKPLDLEELQARVRALLRRGEVTPTPLLQIGQLKLDPSSFEVTYDSKQLILTPKEYNLLELFMRNPARVFSRGQIVEHIWTFDDPPLEDSVKGHIKTLRQKLKAVGATDWIENVYGIGYRLKAGIEQTQKQKHEDSEVIQNLQPKTQNSDSPKQQYKQDVEDLWQRYQELMAQRLDKLKQVTIALEHEALAPELHQEAKQAAHKLAGVLGMFERDAGTLLARQIEQILRQDAVLLLGQTHQLASLIQELEQLLNLKKSAPSTSSDTAQLPPHPAYSIHLLVVDDDPIFLATLQPMLAPWGIRITGLDEPLRFREMLRMTQPDLLILDVDMPHLNGIELCQAVRIDPDWQDLPILFVTACCERDTIQQIFAAGADDYITKPVVGEELLTRITNRLERIRLLQRLSTKDPLTGLMNQVHSSRRLNAWLQQAERCCFAVFTIALHSINLEFGHEIGNQILQQWGRLLQFAFRQAEVLGYWGNGDFVVGFPDLSKAQARDRLAEISTKLRQQIFTATKGHRFQPLFTVGVAEFPTDGLTLQALYHVARTSQSHHE